MAKKNEKKVVKLFEDKFHFVADDDIVFDYDKLSVCKETVREVMSNLQDKRYPPKSLYLKMYEDQIQRTQEKNAVFNQALNS